MINQRDVYWEERVFGRGAGTRISFKLKLELILIRLEWGFRKDSEYSHADSCKRAQIKIEGGKYREEGIV